ncbi:MAG: glycosyltransferase family 2 protein [Nitrospirae bacterium]|nr:glycosyltransferase family 2 protein [Nitrospirota bacterium]
MTSVALTLFWFSAALVLYTYIGYPVLLRSLPARRDAGTLRRDDPPRVSVVVAVRDEEAVIGRRIDNLRTQDYPEDHIEIVVASDGSTDGTERVVKEHMRFDGRIRFVALPRPAGKAVALNAGLQAASGEVVVFADARQSFNREAVRRLLARFDDPKVGAVSGELVLNREPSQIGEGVSAYWSYEKWIRKAESDIGSMVGATGCIYAIRKELFEPIPEGTLLDDVWVPMRIVLKGYRVVFEPRAQAFDSVSKEAPQEFRRKVRTLAGNLQIVYLMPELTLPWRNPVAFQFVSHKLLRLAVPFALMLMLVSNLFLRDGIYTVTLCGQVVWYLFGLLGTAWTGGGLFRKMASVPAAFLVLNAAAVVGIVRFLRGKKDLWVRG